MADAPQSPPAAKFTAQQRLQFALGGNIFEVELLRDKVDELTAQLAERDATIEQMLSAMKPEQPEDPQA